MISLAVLFISLLSASAFTEAHELVQCDDLPNYVTMTQDLCSSETMFYDFDASQCYSPDKNPSHWNCAFLHLAYNADNDECCEPETTPPNCREQNLLWHPTSNECYDPAQNPCDVNCNIYGLDFNENETLCQKRGSGSGWYGTGGTKGCSNGELPIVDDSGTATGSCGTCGWCQAYNSLGEPACTVSGECTLICPTGMTVTSKWGSLYCCAEDEW